MRGLVAVGVYRISPPKWSRWCRAVFTRAGEQLRSEGGASTSNTSHGNTRDDVRWYRQLRDGYFLREVLWGATCAALGALVFALVGTRNDNDGNARQREKLSASPQQHHAASSGSERADTARDGSETNSSHLPGASKGAADAQSADRALYAFIPASIHASELLAGLLPQVRQLWQQVAVDLSNAAAPQLPRSFSPTSLTDEMQPSSSERQLVVGSRSITAAVGEDGEKAGRGAVLGRYFIADAAAKAAPVVVNITTTFRGENKSIQGRCAGSGFLICPDGTIITNAHVVDERLQGCASAKREILVHLQDGRAFSGEVRNIDRHSDIAVVKVSSDEQLPAAQLGSSSALRAGEWVVALGSPLELHNSVTAGIVSCVERRGSDMGLVSAESSYFDYIQTDCSINKGNSGGPLVDLDGRVVGVSTMKALAANGISFAIPIDSVKDILEQFEKHGRVIRPYVGIQMLELSPAIVRQLQRRDRQFPSVSGGILVPTVFPGSPADRAGMQVGDIITGCNGVEGPLTVAVLVQRLAKNVGSPTKLSLLRDGRPLTLTVEAVESPP